MITITMTRKQAYEQGLLVCKRCSWPKSSHFSFAPHTCAHAECKGYIEAARVGRLINRRKLEKLPKTKRKSK